MRLIYVTDPMCSWCYGFAPEIDSIKGHFSEWDFQMVMGGLRPYNTTPIVEMKEFLREHWKQVRARSGQPFNFDILDSQDFVYDTEPAARATVLMRALAPQHEFSFFKEVQKAFYVNNFNVHQVDTYVSILQILGLHKYRLQFVTGFETDDVKKRVRGDFELSTTLGVRGFPSLVLKNGKEYYLVSRGYEKACEIISRIEEFL